MPGAGTRFSSPFSHVSISFFLFAAVHFVWDPYGLVTPPGQFLVFRKLLFPHLHNSRAWEAWGGGTCMFLFLCPYGRIPEL